MGDPESSSRSCRPAPGRAAAPPTEFRYFQAWTFSDGKVVRWENTRDRESALAAVKAG